MKLFFGLLVVFFLGGCSNDGVKRDAPVSLHWDRDMCDRCVMVISDRKNALQLRDPHTNRVYKFDDVGCLALWFKEENVDYKDSVKIWVTDLDSGDWIDAREAFWTAENITPMGFGFSAHKSKENLGSVEVLSFQEVLERVK